MKVIKTLTIYACVVLLVVGVILIISDEESKTMDSIETGTNPNSGMPKIDMAVPAHIETATFAMG